MLDAHRARKNHSAANLGIIRRAALNMLRANDDSPISMKRRKGKRLTTRSIENGFSLARYGLHSAIALRHSPSGLLQDR